MASKSYHGTVCKTCRRRGKKCDKLLPICSTCTDKGIPCEGYAFRWTGVASRGKLAGKQAPVADKLSPETPKGRSRKVPKTMTVLPLPEPPHTESHDMEAAAASETSEEVELLAFELPTIDEADVLDQFDTDMSFLGVDEFMQNGRPDLDLTDIYDFDSPFPILGPQTIFPSIPSPTPRPSILDIQPSYLPQTLAPMILPPEISSVLEYYATESAPRLSIDNTSSRNPYMKYILPLAIHVPSLLYACVALASCQFDIRCSDEDYRIRSLRYRGKAMKRLQESLYSEERAKEDGTLATILMLALCDIALGGSAGFETHFLGARKLVDLRVNKTTPDGFVEQYLAWLDTMSAASHHRLPVFSANEIATWTMAPDSSRREWSFDVIPCPVDQFELIHQILHLYKSQADPNSPTASVLSQVYNLKTQILQRPMKLEKGEPLLHLTEAYRFAIVLYLLRLFHCGNDADEIAWLTGSVFFHAQATVPTTGWADQLLWPLFHAALEIKDEQRKEWLRDRASSMQRSGGFRNVESAMQLLEGVWDGTSPRNYMDLVTSHGQGSMMFV